MKRGQMPHGYTIIEVMIFLVVTGALLVSALGVFNGQQNRTRFTQALREFDSQIRAVATETETGYYPNTNFSCLISTGAPALSASGGVGQGSNQDCVLLGKMIQFGLNGAGCTNAVHTTCTQYASRVIMGRRLDTNGQEIQNLEDPDGGGSKSGARPRLAVGAVDLSIVSRVPASLNVYRVYQVRSGAVSDIGSIAFIYPLSSYATSSTDPVSGSRSIDLVTIPGSLLGDTANNGAAVHDVISEVRNLRDSNRQPDSVVVCISDGPNNGTNRRGSIVIGSQGRQLTTQVSQVLNNATIPGGGC